jgi:glutathione peroxidase
VPRTNRALLAALFSSSLFAACADAKPPQPGGATSGDPAGASAPGTGSPSPQVTTMSFHDFTMNAIDGQPKALSDFKGKVLLVVNTASECGYTPQYAGLVRLHEKIKDKGFSVLGFPSNDFGAQEPGSDQEIAQFCDSRFKVSFPLFSKSVVKGGGKSPLYAFLTAAPPAGEVKWNFEKFLIGKDGKVVGRYPSSVDPEDPKLAADIEAALGR